MCRIKGLEEFVCYDEFWLEKDMENMGYMFEFCDQYCQDLYGVWIDKIKFLDAFMHSDMRVLMEIGHPRFVSQAAKSTLEIYVDEDFKSDLSAFAVPEQKRYPEAQFYWVGWAYAYIHFQSKLSSEHIINKLPLVDMLFKYYPGGHSMGIDHFYNNIKGLL